MFLVTEGTGEKQSLLSRLLDENIYLPVFQVLTKVGTAVDYSMAGQLVN